MWKQKNCEVFVLCLKQPLPRSINNNKNSERVKDLSLSLSLLLMQIKFCRAHSKLKFFCQWEKQGLDHEHIFMWIWYNRTLVCSIKDSKWWMSVVRSPRNISFTLFRKNFLSCPRKKESICVAVCNKSFWS